MIKGKTPTGFEYEIDKEALDDYEVLEKFGEMEGNPSVISQIIDKLLGVEQKEELKEHVRSESGRVSAKRMGEELNHIFEGQQETKNY